ncbi:hypothetical protein NMG60_11020407 [Bertholletia excelsa]
MVALAFRFLVLYSLLLFLSGGFGVYATSAPNKGPFPPPPPPPSPPPPLLPPPAPPAPEPREYSKGLTGGSKAGTVIGVLAAVYMVGFGAMVYKKRRDYVGRYRNGYAARRDFL